MNYRFTGLCFRCVLCGGPVPDGDAVVTFQPKALDSMWRAKGVWQGQGGLLMFDRVWGGPKGAAGWWLRPMLLATIVAIVFALTTAPSHAAPKFSAIAVDARNGKVLYSVDPDGSRYPASLTKVMTLYLLFQDLKAGKVSLKTPLKVSSQSGRNAAVEAWAETRQHNHRRSAPSAHLSPSPPTMSHRSLAKTLAEAKRSSPPA